jgi:hypothetical protein
MGLTSKTLLQSHVFVSVALMQGVDQGLKAAINALLVNLLDPAGSKKTACF